MWLCRTEKKFSKENTESENGKSTKEIMLKLSGTLICFWKDKKVKKIALFALLYLVGEMKNSQIKGKLTKYWEI